MLASFAASARTVRLAAALLGALALGACAKDQNADGFGAGGAATPGSAQDFVVNVGDRVFFETDSTDLTPTAVATLDKQSQWLQRYPRYTFTIEGHAESAAPANTTIRSAPAAPRRSAIISPRAASPATASAPSPTARSGRSRSATTSPAGRRTAAP